DLVDKYADNYFLLAKMYCDWGKYDAAIEAYTSALQIDPEVAKFWAYLALAYAEVSRTQTITLPTTAGINKRWAKDACEKALSYLPKASPRMLNGTLDGIIETYKILGEQSSQQ